MVSAKVKRKFIRSNGRTIWGRQRQFIRWAATRGVRLPESTVNAWLHGDHPFEHIAKLAREWKPGAPATVPTRQSAPAPQTPETATTTTAA